MRKKTEYEIVRVEKTEDEDELEKALRKFEEVCNIYEKIMGEKFKGGAEGNIAQARREVIKSITAMTNHMTTLAKKDFDAYLMQK